MKRSFQPIGYGLLLAAVIWMLMIFIGSSQTATIQKVDHKLEHIMSEQQLARILPQWEFIYGNKLISYQSPYDMFSFFFRKVGHILEFMVLTWLVLGVCRYASLTVKRSLLISGLLSFGYAISDEWHQTFIDGRSGLWTDVLIDTIGIGIGLTGFILFTLIRKTRPIRHSAKDNRNL